MSDLSMLIDGLAVSAEKGATFERLNPLDGSVATRAPAASATDAVAAVEAAAQAFGAWSRTGPNERRALLLNAADALEARTPAFVEAMATETGATAMWAAFNAHLAAGMLREAAALTTQVAGEVIPSDVPGSLAMGVRQPAGVVLGIAPWNAPIILGVRAIATPLACGNTVGSPCRRRRGTIRSRGDGFRLRACEPAPAPPRSACACRSSNDGGIRAENRRRARNSNRDRTMLQPGCAPRNHPVCFGSDSCAGAPLPSYLISLLQRSRRLFFVLVKVMLPVMIAVEIGKRLGWIDALGSAIAPAMAWIDLPPEAGLIWITGVFVGVYGAIAALVGLAPGLELSAAQFSALCAMVMFAHALPVEQAIVRRAGGSFGATAALRLGVALAYGAAVAWLCRLAGVLSEPVSFAWLQGSALAAEGGDGSLLGWASATAFSLSISFAIIVGLLIVLDLLERSGLQRRITVALAPLLRVSGLDASAAPVTTVGVLLGLTYGGALIIEEAERRRFSARTRFLALAWLSLSHALIEDTALLLALGANIWIVLVGRVLVTLAVIAALARLLDGGDRARGGGGAETAQR